MSDEPAPPPAAGAATPEPHGEHHHATPHDLTEPTPPSLVELLGGPLGIAESSLPTIVFVIAKTGGASIRDAAIAAVVVAALFAAGRLIKRDTQQFALAGVIGVGFSAWIASRTGEARDFFLPGFLANVAYAAIAFGSVLFRRPFVGYFVENLSGANPAWREDPIKYQRYRLASLVWGGLFLLRLAVQLPLYFADQLVALGTAKVVMGVPLFAVGIWLTWLIVRERPGDAAPAAPAAD